mgnify:CR=1 FL=1
MNVDSSNNEKEKEIKITENTKKLQKQVLHLQHPKRKRIYYIK